ncbi:MAG: leucyl aminopeptidase [bacterium]|nr:leucyl aminopeptidase [bacterium]
MLEITFSKSATFKADTLVVGATSGKTLTAVGRDMDAKTQGSLTRALENSRFKGNKGQTLLINAPFGLECARVLILGLGTVKNLKVKDFEELGAKITATLRCTPDKTVEIILDDLSSDANTCAYATARIASGALLRSWHFDKYKTKEAKDKKPQLSKVHLICQDAKEAEQKFGCFKAIAEGVFLAREVISEPPNVMYPEAFAQKAKDLESLGLDVEILDEKQMEKLGFGSLLCVGQGSDKASYLAIMKWNGGKTGDKPLAFVGKGVCFDTGGISLKPPAGMEDMKWDMAGAGAVIGLMKALAGRKAKVNALGVLGLVENMPSGSAVKPSDIVTSLSGQTIEVLNTDAEGRLVLADALWYTQDRFKPQVMIDLATLTGAMIVSLGSVYAGTFTNDKKLADQLHTAGEATGERVWQMPLDKAYNKQMDSSIADVANIGTPGREAGSITAAEFLQRFVNDTPWVHIDIAGVTWTNKASPVAEKGTKGFGVRLLDEWVYQNYENK